MIALATLTTHQERRNARHHELSRLRSVEHGKGPISLLTSTFSRFQSRPGGKAAFLKSIPPSRLGPSHQVCLTPPLHAHSFSAHVTILKGAYEFDHVMIPYLKELDISGLATNESSQEACDLTTCRGCVQGSATTAIGMETLKRKLVKPTYCDCALHH